MVLVRGAPPPEAGQPSAESLRVLEVLLAELPLKQAAGLAARITGEKKNALYRIALDRGEG
ncbi:MAG TPA: hypothetical protein EYP07_10790 [Kiloniellaceae bacterium]|nr:hypothetical protein [Kiloniellaceae bacterium]